MAKKNTKSKRSKSDIKMSRNLDMKFAENFGESERFGNEIVTQQNVADAAMDLSRKFGANKNLYRTTPNLISGLKPGHTRLLYSWWEKDNCPSNTSKEQMVKVKNHKIEIVVANSVNYHPHGTSATGDLVGKLGQYWNNNVMEIVPQGSYGNMRNEEPSAMRYIEGKLSEYTIDCFFDDFKEYCIPMKKSYNGESWEPEYLPAKYPHVLFNPQFSGIGYGMASNIPPFNVSEVLDATIQLMRDPSSKILLIPDSPTGCDIVDTGYFKDINETGIGKVTMRASAEIDYVNNVITITSLPLISMSAQVINKIISKQSNGGSGKKVKDSNNLFDEIVEIKDDTKEGNVNIRIYLKPDAKPEKVLDYLYKKDVGLKSGFSVGITVIDDFVSYDYGVKDLLLAWIDYRQDAVRSMLLNKLQNLLSDQHMNEVLLFVFNKDNIDKTITIAKTSKSRKETIERLVKTFKITSLQAETIADMHVYNFNEDSYNKYKDKEIKLKDEIERVETLLDDEEKMNEFIIQQLEDGKKKYGRPRQSKVVKENDKHNENIANTEHLIGITESGLIKKIELKNNTSIGPIGKTNSNITVLNINNRESLLVIDSTGAVIKIPISSIPDMDYEDTGIELKKFFNVKGSIKAVMELPSMDILKVKDESMGIIFITKNGLAKKVQISEFKKLTDSKPGIALNDNDEVAAALFSFNSQMKDIVIYTNQGNGIRLPLDEIRLLGATAKGVSMISLQDGEEVVGASMVNPKKKLLFFITSNGRAKVTETKYFPVMKRKDSPVSLIALQGNETLLGLSSVDKNDVVMVYRKQGDPETVNINSLEIGTRVSKGEKIIKTGRSDVVVAYKVFSNK